MGPLQGVRVVEFEGIGPPPFCGMMLADMGAEVILLERVSANPNQADVGLNNDNPHAFYHRGKQRMGVDLKSADGIAVVLELINKADVVIEGFRPGVLERLGLGPDVCLERNPKLVFARLTGWGQTGPLAMVAGHEPNYMGVSGASYYTGTEDSIPQPPITLIGDIGGGAVMAGWGIACALLHVEKTGQGQVIDAAITDGSAYLTGFARGLQGIGKLSPKRGVNWTDGGSPWAQTYRCADGEFVAICALEPNFYKELLKQLGLTDEPLFTKQWDTSKWPEMKTFMADLLKQKSRDDWCAAIEGSDACFAPVLNYREAEQHPHNKARGTFFELNGVMQPSPAPSFSHTQAEVSGSLKGYDSARVLAEAGVDAELAQRVLAEGVIK